jgi:hypothetical protein
MHSPSILATAVVRRALPVANVARLLQFVAVTAATSRSGHRSFVFATRPTIQSHTQRHSRPSSSYTAASAVASVVAAAGVAALYANNAVCDAAPAAPAVVVTKIKEPESETMFPVKLSPTEHLVAAGVRKMTPLKVMVYSIGLYADPVDAATALAPWADASADMLLADGSFWNTLTSPSEDMHRTLRLQVIREVDGKHMQHG